MWLFQSGPGRLCSSLKQREVFVSKTNLNLCCLTCSRSLALSGFAWKWLVISNGWWSCALASSLSSLHWRTSSCWNDGEFICFCFLGVFFFVFVFVFLKALHWDVEDSRNDALGLDFFSCSDSFCSYWLRSLLDTEPDLFWLSCLGQDLLVTNRLFLANLGLKFYAQFIQWPVDLPCSLLSFNLTAWLQMAISPRLYYRVLVGLRWLCLF